MRVRVPLKGDRDNFRKTPRKKTLTPIHSASESLKDSDPNSPRQWITGKNRPLTAFRKRTSSTYLNQNMATKKNFSSNSPSGLTPWLGIATIIILLDQITKFSITKLFTYGEQYTLTSFFNLVLAYNKGAAFSFLAGESGWQRYFFTALGIADRKSTRLNSSHIQKSRMPSSA